MSYTKYQFMTKVRFLIFLYILTILGLFLYSYTQVDLSLTLSRVSLWQTIEKTFQHIGYFQRPLSTGLYIVILLLLFSSYAGFLFAAYKKTISRKTVWIVVIVTAVILTFSYNAFSYDLFNYIFDAKIVTHYHLNPYQHKALDFAQDPMLSFMHWVERTYPYGPLWLVITLPFSFMGGQIFLITFYLFKIIASLSYVGTAFFVERIVQKTTPKNSLFSLVLFALSPLVIIEALVSAHNDIVMIFLSTMALYLLINKQYVTSFTSFIASVTVKFATGIWLPLWLVLAWYQKSKRQIPYELLVMTGAVLSVIPVVLATTRTNFQPWYFLYMLPFAALLKKPFIFIPYSIFSFFALLQYIPFLYTGNWDPPIPILLNQISLVGIVLSIVTLVTLLVANFSVAKRP